MFRKKEKKVETYENGEQVENPLAKAPELDVPRPQAQPEYYTPGQLYKSGYNDGVRDGLRGALQLVAAELDRVEKNMKG